MKHSNHTVYVVAGAILVFSPDTSESVREDILDSTLFLQLTVTRKFPRISDFSQWAEAYISLSRSLEWTLPSPWSKFFSVTNSTDLRLGYMVGTLLSPQLSCAQVKQIDLALSRIATIPLAVTAAKVLREHAVECSASEEANVFVEKDAGTTTPYLARLRVQVGYVDEAGRLTCVRVYFETTEVIRNDFLVEALAAKQVVGNIHVSGFVAELDDFDYESSRKRIITALGSQRQGKIVKIDD